jgi:hypothetical protein
MFMPCSERAAGSGFFVLASFGGLASSWFFHLTIHERQMLANQVYD